MWSEADSDTRHLIEAGVHGPVQVAAAKAEVAPSPLSSSTDSQKSSSIDSDDPDIKHFLDVHKEKPKAKPQLVQVAVAAATPSAA